MRVERFDRYRGDDKAKIKNVKFVFTHNDAAYSDVLGNRLDFLGNVPPQGLAGNLWQDDLPGRAKAYPIMAIQTIAFPLYDLRYAGADFRHAISIAINREQITKTIFEGARKPINGYAMNLVPATGMARAASGASTTPTEAKKLFDNSGWTGPIQITSSIDGGNKEWPRPCAARSRRRSTASAPSSRRRGSASFLRRLDAR